MTVPDPDVVAIESLDSEGRGVARVEGKVVFVEGALPGETVRVETLRRKPKYETARVVEVLRSSSQRVTPRCPHYGVHAGACGGCSMQHLDPAAQVAIKQRALEDALWHIGRVRPEIVLRPCSGPDWGYRHRARLSVRFVAKKGGVLVGFHERRSNYVADIRQCPILPGKVGSLIVGLRELFSGLSIRDRLPQVEVAVAGSGELQQVVLVLRVLEEPSDQDRAMLIRFSLERGIELWLQTGGPETAQPLAGSWTGRPLRLFLGEHGVSIPFGPTDFTQVNHPINEVLVARALRLLEPTQSERVVDFFCGLGNFTLPLARRAKQAIGIESSAALVARAEAAARQHDLGERTRFLRRDLFAFTVRDWEQLSDESGGIDIGLIDPPREGALAVVRALCAARAPPRRLVYVSCNAATLARDVAILHHEAGWRLRAAGVINMFPHTSHVESIALLVTGSRTPPEPLRAGASDRARATIFG